MTKNDLAKSVSKRTGLALPEAVKAVDAVVDAIKEEVFQQGNDLTINAFGTFKKQHYAAKTARNIQSGGTVNVPAKDKLVFKMSKTF